MSAAVSLFDRRNLAIPDTIAELLNEREIDPATTFAYRLSLHPDDVSEDFRTLDDLIKARTIGMYQRLQDTRRFGTEACVLTFLAEPLGKARFWGFHRFLARRKGVAPGDIIYDYDAYHLLHAFISRARHPIFYDTLPLDGLADLEGQLVVQWPQPVMRNIIRASDTKMRITSL